MKKLIASFIFIFVLYVIYYDLSQGTLSKPTSIVLLQNTEKTQNNETKKIQKDNDSPAIEQDLYFQEVKVAAGQTVLSIVEQIHNGPLPVSIPELVSDFKTLNPAIQPEKIQIGKTYKFPVYQKSE